MRRLEPIVGLAVQSLRLKKFLSPPPGEVDGIWTGACKRTVFKVWRHGLTSATI